MSIRIALLSGMAAVAFASLSASASAATMMEVWEGVVSTSVPNIQIANPDTGNFLFGLGDLADQPYTMTFIYDTNLGAHDYSNPERHELYGGSQLGFATPITSAVLTINGHTEFVTASRIGKVTNVNDPPNVFSSAHAEAYDNTPVNIGGATSRLLVSWGFTYTLAIPLSLETAFVFDQFDPLNYGEGQFDFFETKFDNNTGGLVYNYISSGNLRATRLSVSRLDASPVPIPAALPLFAAGLGAMGFFGWRRRKAAVAA